ncbi:MAG: ATP-binding protein [Verrucomicrobiota bacterium]
MKTFHERLDSIAEGYGLHIVESAKEFVETDKPLRLFRAEPGGKVTLSLLNAHSFDADAFVYDACLGTVALLWDANRAPNKSGKLSRDWIAKKIDDAVFFKDRLVSELPHGDGEAKACLQVEAVFAHDAPPDDDDDDREQCGQLGDELRQMLRDTEMLPSIGVHQWCYGKVDEASDRKAFCWLLHETRQLLKATTKPSKDAFRRFPVHSITMTNFRLSGTRTWSFEPQAQLVVYQGQNGSGKSSLIDAVEMIQTGKIERVSGDLADTVRHHGADELKLTYETSVKKKGVVSDWEKGKASLPTLGKKRLSGSSIRFNERFEERMFQSDEMRAHLILEAFFPGERDQIVAVLDAQKEVVQAFSKLPKRLQNQVFLDGFKGKDTAFLHFSDVLGLKLKDPEDIEELGRLLAKEDESFSILTVDEKFKEISEQLPDLRKSIDGAGRPGPCRRASSCRPDLGSSRWGP